MKKLFALLLLAASPLFGQVQMTNKMNNTVLILSSNSSFTYLKGPLVAGYVLTSDANGVSTWAVAGSGGGGDVFRGSNNTFTAANTFNGPTTNNGAMTTSNVLVRGTLTVQGVTTLQTNTYIYNAGTSARLGINTNIPGAILDVHAGGDTNATMVRIVGTANRNAPYFEITNTATGSIFLIDKNGNITTSTNITIGGYISQLGTASSNLFLASSNYFAGLINAPNTGTHRLGGVTFSFSTVGSGGTLTLAGTATIISPSSGAVTINGSQLNVNTNAIFRANVTVSNNLFVVGTTTLGSNGSARIFTKTATASLDFPSILAAGNSDLTITVGGANTNDIVSMGRPVDEDASLVTRGLVTAPNTVTVRANNVGSLAVDQGAKTYRVEVTQY